MTPEQFIERWEKSAGAELANSQSFLKELCDLLDVPQPEPTQADREKNRYVFEKAVEFNNGDGTVSVGRVDLFRSGCFVLESKQGSERKAAEQAEALATVTKTTKKLVGTAPRNTTAWDKAMQAARKQAKAYAEAIPDEWPPFLIVVDVGYCFDLYADFSGSGKNYVPFPDPRSFRISLQRLVDEETRATLRSIWLDPRSLDPSKRAATVTREIATQLAKLAKSLENQHEPEVVAGFLMRCLFTMFAEDVDLIRKGSFSDLLKSLRSELHNFKPMVESLWEAMDKGTFSIILREKIKHFNGKFFKDKTALPLTRDQLELLIEAASSSWEFVEPSIFGTLLERALDPVERHKLGAHFTPRAYVERLVYPTIIEPLREEWDATYAAAVQLDEEGNRKEAIQVLRDFHRKLCETKVLDPACGSGNFLYVAMELMKRLEGEVIAAMASFGDLVLPGITIDPHQFLGIEINPRAAALAELVLWIGFIQWHRRTRTETTPPEPILKDYGNIECRDAVLEWDSIEPVVDADGKPVTRWDGRTTKPHPVTSEEVPDETARVQELRYVNPRRAVWPEAHFIVGNPPFIGDKRQNYALGVGYTQAIREIYDEVPKSADYVMFWWTKAARIVSSQDAIRFGLITTNSIRQSFNRRVVDAAINGTLPFSIAFAVPDHPWVASEDGAAVRISMTVGCGVANAAGRLATLKESDRKPVENMDVLSVVREGKIASDLTIGADVTSSSRLRANSKICSNGVGVYGRGFVLDNIEESRRFGSEVGPISPIMNGRDITDRDRGRFVIDLFGLNELDVQNRYPAIFQHVLTHVKPERMQNNREIYRKCWWIFGEPRKSFRPAIAGLSRFIGTPRTAKHRVFVFISSGVIVETEIVAVALSEAFVHGVLSSSTHVKWSHFAGSVLENRPRYNASICFDMFPFPLPGDATKKRISDLAEQLDAHRKRQQALHPSLTMTGMYNVLEKLRSGEPLTAKEQVIHEQGLVSVLKQIHDDLDAAVFDAYGWPHDLTDEDILQRLVDLNHERAEEESRGIIRWLRPEFQNPADPQATFVEVADDEADLPKKGKAKTAKPKIAPPAKKIDWPKSLPDRIRAVRSELEAIRVPVASKEIASRFVRAPKTAVSEILDTLVAVGKARQLDDGRYAI